MTEPKGEASYEFFLTRSSGCLDIGVSMPSTSADFVGRCYFRAASYLLEERGTKIIVTGPLVYVRCILQSPGDFSLDSECQEICD